jgi:DNA-binding HxlR family transcriptional regulator
MNMTSFADLADTIMTDTAFVGTAAFCPKVNEILARVGDKWTVLVILTLHSQPKRFNELKRAIGDISQQMLTRTLKGLERDGMVTRTVYPTIPPKVEYALTDLGRSLARPVIQLGIWAAENSDAIQSNRQAFDQRP